MRCAAEQIAAIGHASKARVSLRPTFRHVLTVAGIGQTLALTSMLEAGDMHRFPTMGQWASGPMGLLLPLREQHQTQQWQTQRPLTAVSLGVALLGIRQQRIEPGCPRQNGRVERFIGTVKRELRQQRPISGHEFTQRLTAMRSWYNHDRPHDHLQGRTPAEV